MSSFNIFGDDDSAGLINKLRKEIEFYVIKYEPPDDIDADNPAPDISMCDIIKNMCNNEPEKIKIAVSILFEYVEKGYASEDRREWDPALKAIRYIGDLKDKSTLVRLYTIIGKTKNESAIEAICEAILKIDDYSTTAVDKLLNGEFIDAKSEAKHYAFMEIYKYYYKIKDKTDEKTINELKIAIKKFVLNPVESTKIINYADSFLKSIDKEYAVSGERKKMLEDRLAQEGTLKCEPLKKYFSYELNNFNNQK